VLWQGAQRFFLESFGTWIISPIIYTRICPEFVRAPFIHALAREPILGHLLCAIPVAIFLMAAAFGFVAFRRRSFPVAVAACLLMSSIFVVYHSVKHLGIRLEYYDPASPGHAGS
jgi:hypothetical protein